MSLYQLNYSVTLLKNMKTVLIVDEEKFIRDYVTEILTREGYSVYEGKNGQINVDLIITDIVMEDIEGLELIRIVKGSGNRDLKIIAMSGGGIINAKIYLDIALKMGAHSIIEKPFTDKELLDVVKAISL
jgi:CheY-like chemotaxis protein